MHFLPGEKEIARSRNEELLLTTHRVVKNVKEGSYKEVTCIPLNMLSSAKLRSWNPKFLLYIAAGIIALGLVMAFRENSAGLIGALIFASSFVVAYFIFKREFYEFTAVGGEKILSPAKEGFESCIGFVNQVHTAQALTTSPASRWSTEKAVGS